MDRARSFYIILDNSKVNYLNENCKKFILIKQEDDTTYANVYLENPTTSSALVKKYELKSADVLKNCNRKGDLYSKCIDIAEDNEINTQEKKEKIMSKIRSEEPRTFFLANHNVKKAINSMMKSKNIHQNKTFNREKLSMPKENERNPYTWLLHGPTGTGKTSFALSHFNEPVLVRVIEDLHAIKTTTDGIVFDDFDFSNKTAQNIIHMFDLENDSSINIKYGTATIPRMMPRIVTTNNASSVYPIKSTQQDKDAISRRLKSMYVKDPLYADVTDPEIIQRIKDNKDSMCRKTAVDQIEITVKRKRNDEPEDIPIKKFKPAYFSFSTKGQPNYSSKTKIYLPLHDHDYCYKWRHECSNGCTPVFTNKNCEVHYRAFEENIVDDTEIITNAETTSDIETEIVEFDDIDDCPDCPFSFPNQSIPQLDGCSDFKFDTSKFEDVSPELYAAEDLWDSDVTDEELINLILEHNF